MNSFDVVCIIIVLAAGLVGYFRGLFFQVTTLAAMLASIFLSVYPAQPLAAFFSNNEILNEIHTYYLVRIFSAALLYFFLSILIWYSDTRMTKAGLKAQPWNRMGGLLFGLLKGSVAVFGIILALSFIAPQSVEKRIPSLNHAQIMRWFRQYNPFPHEEIAANLQAAFHILASPSGDAWLEAYLKERGLKVENYMHNLKDHKVIPLIRDNAFRRFISEHDVFQKFHLRPEPSRDKLKP